MLEQSTLTQPTSAGLIRPLFSLPLKNAQIAQLVEQRIENPRVGGSIPPLGTIPFLYLSEPLSPLRFRQHQYKNF